jgi:hypothetical protein
LLAKSPDITDLLLAGLEDRAQDLWREGTASQARVPMRKDAARKIKLPKQLRAVALYPTKQLANACVRGRPRARVPTFTVRSHLLVQPLDVATDHRRIQIAELGDCASLTSESIKSGDAVPISIHRGH